MALSKEDLGQIKEAVAEAITAGPIKKVLKEVILEVTEPMMIASQKEFEKISEKLEGMNEKLEGVNERLVDLDKSNNQAHENMSLRLDSGAHRFELVDLKKRVEVLENKAVTRV